jgi:hypothetical protein
MKKFPKPWFRSSRRVWYVAIGGNQHNLGPTKKRHGRSTKISSRNPDLPPRKSRPVRSSALSTSSLHGARKTGLPKPTNGIGGGSRCLLIQLTRH